MTGYIIMTKTRAISHHTSKMASADHVQEAFLKLSVNPDFSIDLKPEQKEAVNCLLEGRDVFAVMPTGFGKSFIFQLFCTAIEQKKISQGKQANSTVLVICPLTSLIQDQIKEGKSLGLNCASLQDLDDLSSDSPLPQLLFASAEKALDSDFKRILKDRSSKVHKQVELIVIDESHTVEIWTGKRNPKKEKSFRSAYGDLATLRSLSKEGTPVLALTGTADKQTKEVIASSLLLKANTCNIFISPNRINLRINVIKTTKMEALSKLDWLVTMCLSKGINTPKTILFCNTMKDVALLVNHLMQKIGTLAFNPPSSRRPEDCILGIYHSLSWDKYKERLVADFKVNGKKRLVVATTALSMGVNFPDIRYIINWGPARNLLDHHQEAGRAGRDGCQSDVVVIYHGQQLTHCEDEVKEFVKSNGCLRVASYKAFDSDIEPMQPGHDCCSYCRSVCLCDGTACVAEKLPFEEQNTQAIPPNQPTMTRSVCDQDKSDLYDALLQLRETQFASGGELFDKDASHGFSCQLCQDIVEKCSEIFTVEDLMTSFPVFSELHAVKILEVFQEIFNDIEEVFHMTSSPCYPEQVNDFFGYFDFSSDSDSDL